MSESSDLKQWLQQHGYKLKIIYSFAVVHHIDITSKENVLNILQRIDPENANVQQAEVYSKMLQLFKNRLRRQLAKK